MIGTISKIFSLCSNMKLFKSENVSCISRRLENYLKFAKDDIKLCEVWNEEIKSFNSYLQEFAKDAKNIIKDCNYSCTHIQYVGQNTFSKGRGKKVNEILVAYDFLSNEIQIFEEYFMFGINELIGTIGGHSGLFIGFSFYGFISTILEYIKKKVEVSL